MLEFDAPLTTNAAAKRVFGQGGSFIAADCNHGGLGPNSLCEPWGLGMDKLGNLYVSDWSNARVLEYNTPLATGTTADRVFGQGGSFTTASCNKGERNASSLCGPFGVAVDVTGNLFVADGYNNRVLRLRSTPALAMTSMRATNADELTCRRYLLAGDKGLGQAGQFVCFSTSR